MARTTVRIPGRAVSLLYCSKQGKVHRGGRTLENAIEAGFSRICRKQKSVSNLPLMTTVNNQQSTINN